MKKTDKSLNKLNYFESFSFFYFSFLFFLFRKRIKMDRDIPEFYEDGLNRIQMSQG